MKRAKNRKRPPAIRPVKSGGRLGGQLAQGRSGRPAPAPRVPRRTLRVITPVTLTASGLRKLVEHLGKECDRLRAELAKTQADLADNVRFGKRMHDRAVDLGRTVTRIEQEAAGAASAAQADQAYRESILADALHVSILEAVDQLRPGMSIWGINTIAARTRALLHFWPCNPNSDAVPPGPIEEEGDAA